jgi:hypothetical protein
MKNKTTRAAIVGQEDIYIRAYIGMSRTEYHNVDSSPFLEIVTFLESL